MDSVSRKCKRDQYTHKECYEHTTAQHNTHTKHTNYLHHPPPEHEHKFGYAMCAWRGGVVKHGLCWWAAVALGIPVCTCACAPCCDVRVVCKTTPLPVCHEVVCVCVCVCPIRLHKTTEAQMSIIVAFPGRIGNIHETLKLRPQSLIISVPF